MIVKINFVNFLKYVLKNFFRIRGSGILAMARAFADGGLVISTIATPFIGIIMSGCIHLLVRVSAHLCEKLRIEPMNYEDVRHLINIYYY
jgi:hypothetical protein